MRINLSEHSEISDLLGADLPVADEDSGGGAGEGKGKDDKSATGGSSSSGGGGGSGGGPKFVWCDGVFLQALKQGHWVLLDELNLAPQSVLEGQTYAPLYHLHPLSHQ